MADIVQRLIDLHTKAQEAWAFGTLDQAKAAQSEFENARDALRAEVARVTAELDALMEANRWIPVGERLPHDYDFVLFWADTDDVHIGFHSKIPQWSSEDGGYWHGPTYSWITHWRPLPAPPESEAK